MIHEPPPFFYIDNVYVLPGKFRNSKIKFIPVMAVYTSREH